MAAVSLVGALDGGPAGRKEETLVERERHHSYSRVETEERRELDGKLWWKSGVVEREIQKGKIKTD